LSYLVLNLFKLVDRIHSFSLLPNTAFSQTASSIPGIGTIGIDHNAFSANFCTFSIFFHNVDAFSAVHTKNHVIAIHITEHTNFPTFTHTPAIFNFIIHHRIGVLDVKISFVFTFMIILISTVDILIAKQTTAGENMIQIRFEILKCSKIELLLVKPSNKSNAVNNAISGDNTIAAHITHILIINTNSITNNGIAIASICHNDMKVFNVLEYIHSSVVELNLRFIHASINDEYKDPKTHA